jgi:hypothetical protein
MTSKWVSPEWLHDRSFGGAVEVYLAADVRALLDLVPDNWLDSLLTGEKAVIGNPPYTCQDIECVLRAVKERLQQALGPGRDDAEDRWVKRMERERKEAGDARS